MIARARGVIHGLEEGLVASGQRGEVRGCRRVEQVSEGRARDELARVAAGAQLVPEGGRRGRLLGDARGVCQQHLAEARKAPEAVAEARAPCRMSGPNLE